MANIIATESSNAKRTMPQQDSSESLDIKDVLSGTDYESLLSASLTFQSSTDSTRSLIEVPPFETVSGSRAVFVAVTASSVLSHGTASPSAGPDISRGAPTTPRLKSMLMEPICVSKWTERLTPDAPPEHGPWTFDSDDAANGIPVPWIPEGSIFPPEAFRAILRHRRSMHQADSTAATTGPQSPPERPLASVISSDAASQGLGHGIANPSPSDLSSPLSPEQPVSPLGSGGSGGILADSPAHLAIPTIMLSNSTAALPVPLESSSSLSPVLPLAVRRGHKVAPLSLIPNIKDKDSYPGMPTAFLGSPSSYSPTFEFSNANPVTLAMTVDAMCDDLRSRCPPMLFPETPRLLSVPIRKHAPGSAASLSSVASTDSSNEWAFAEDFLKRYGDEASNLSSKTTSPILESVPALSPTSTATNADSLTWGDSPTRTSIDSPGAQPSDRPTPRRRSSTDASKQQRRKTVIIETAASSTRRHTHLAIAADTLVRLSHADDFDQPVPFETPLHFSPGALALAQSTPPPPAHSRPPSSATLKAPAKGILKEKKSVRFSVMPSMHEYAIDESESESNSPPRERERKSEDVPAATRRQSQLKSASASSPVLPQTRQRSPLSQSFVAQVGKWPAKEKDNRTSFPKHPAVRTLARESSTRTSGSLSPQTPTPALATSARRSALRMLDTNTSANARQSLPVSATPKKTVKKEDVGSPKKLARGSASASLPSRRRMTMTVDENMGRREGGIGSLREGSPGKSRMPVPFRSILTKLRT